MKLRTTALLLVLALFAVAAPVATADDGKAAIDEYAESLPAGEGKVHPALSGSKPKKKDGGSSSSSSGGGTTPPATSPQQQAPSTSGDSSSSSSSGSSSGSSSDKPKKDKKKDKSDDKDEKDDANASAGTDSGDKDKAILDRIESDPALGAPPAPTAAAQNASATSDDGDGVFATVFDPGGALLWLLLAMVALVVFGAVRLGRSRTFDAGPGADPAS